MDTINNTTPLSDSKIGDKKQLLKLYRSCLFSIRLYDLPHIEPLIKKAFKYGTSSLNSSQQLELLTQFLNIVDCGNDVLLEAMKLGTSDLKSAA